MINWNKFDILFGNPLFDIPLNLILIKAKQFMYSMKMKKSFPGFVNFKTYLLHFFHTEEYIAKRNFDLDSFNLMRNGITIWYYYSNFTVLRVQ